MKPKKAKMCIRDSATLVPGKKSERTVFTMAKFTIPDDKCLVVELNEKNGGRHQSDVYKRQARPCTGQDTTARYLSF